jgi:hypothetical protein
MRATETYVEAIASTTSTATSSAISTNGATLGTIQVDDAASGTFTVVVKGRAHESAEWQTLYVTVQAGTRASSISGEGLYELRLFGIRDVQVSITAISSATLTVYLGVNS